MSHVGIDEVNKQLLVDLGIPNPGTPEELGEDDPQRTTEDSYLVIDINKGKKFRLRICKSPQDAIRISASLKKVKSCGAVPEVIGIKDEYLLLEYIEGRPFDVVGDVAKWTSLGRVYRNLHNVPTQGGRHASEVIEPLLLRLSNSDILDTKFEQAVKKIEHALGLVEIAPVWSIRDINTAHLVVKRSGEVFIVAEDAFAVVPRFTEWWDLEINTWQKEEKQRFSSAYGSEWSAYANKLNAFNALGMLEYLSRKCGNGNAKSSACKDVVKQFLTLSKKLK